jgi:hypothetical protein
MTTILRIHKIFQDQISLLIFKKFKPNLSELKNWYISFGIITAWLAGVGRYWDNPKAELWQYLGLGSVVYCFFLALIIYLIIYPLKPKNWSYSNVLIFVSLTSLPAFIYAIPVEKFTSLETAQFLNVIFLAIVALWRVALFVHYLKNSASLSGLQIFVAAFLPIVFIINILTYLNLEHVVFRIMAGLQDNEPTGNDSAYQILFLITLLSNILLPFLVVIYGWFIYKINNTANK